MHKKLSIFVLSFAVIALAGQARADAIAWDKIVGIELSKLTAENKTTIEGYLNKISNTRGCTGTLAKCLAADDMTARRHAGYVARMVRKGKDEAFIKKGISDRHASAFPEETFDIDLADHPYKGDPKAKVVMVEYACFQCPFCAHLAPKFKDIEGKFGGKVVHYYKFFPVRSHPRGVQSALAGYAAMRQGKFWPLSYLLFENRANLGDSDLLKYAKQVGLDETKYNAAIKDSAAMRYIEKDKLEGMRFGVEGTPTFYINGKQYVGTQDFDEIMDRLGEELDIVEGRIK